MVSIRQSNLEKFTADRTVLSEDKESSCRGGARFLFVLDRELSRSETECPDQGSFTPTILWDLSVLAKT